jgi:ABC-type dipeptide/oligopeptide/nickel transport system ATPase component
MRADRILVVMNGEIVEEGTHDELIHAKGKYLGLWSKQVYVKPADDRARSQSPKKRDAEIINDLTPSRQKAELAKIMKTTAHEEPPTHEQSTKQSAKDSDQTVNVSKQSPTDRTEAELPVSPKGREAVVKGHKREVRDGSP